tara:strand:- start:39 stop:755 length:717 start_codon:yes stop_codon:yes gene_type:complete
MDLKRINNLISNIVDIDRFSLVSKPLFETVVRNYDNISKLQGDIIECGVWKGGFSVFLSHLFNNKKIWVCDSFGGFRSMKEAKYKKLTYFSTLQGEMTERFQQGDDMGMNIPLSDVKWVFDKYGLKDNPRINFVEGFVNKTLPILNISKISLLRIDVDGYSPTREVLDHLYDKVVPGGMIIFDDLCLVESAEATKDWLIERGIPLEVHNPYNDKVYSLENRVIDSESGFHTGSYIIKK